MEFFDVVSSRNSVRAYAARPVEDKSSLPFWRPPTRRLRPETFKHTRSISSGAKPFWALLAPRLSARFL